MSKKTVLSAFVLKVGAGFAFTLLYTFYYTDKQNADIYKYFEDGISLQNIFFYSPKMFFQLLFEVNVESPDVLDSIKNFNHWDPKVRSMVYNDSRFIIKLNALLSFLSLKSIYIHSLFGSWIGFSGVFAVAKASQTIFQRNRFASMLLLFFPSILFWTSALLKETILVFVMGFFVLMSVSAIENFSWKKILVVVFFFMLLALLKVYVLLSLAPAAFAYYLSRKQSTIIRFTSMFCFVFLDVLFAAFVLNYFLLNGAITEGIAQKQQNMINLAAYMQSGSTIYIPEVSSAKPLTFIYSGFYGVFNVLLQPFVWNAKTPLLLAAALENILLFLFILLFFVHIKKLSLKEWKLTLAILFFALILFGIVGITTPVLGSIVRYRVPGLLLLLIPLSSGVNFLEKGKTNTPAN